MSTIDSIVNAYNDVYRTYQCKKLTNYLLIDFSYDDDKNSGGFMLNVKLMHVCKPAKVLNRLRSRNGFCFDNAMKMALIGYVEPSKLDKSFQCQGCRTTIASQYYTAFLMIVNKDTLKL